MDHLFLEVSTILYSAVLGKVYLLCRDLHEVACYLLDSQVQTQDGVNKEGHNPGKISTLCATLLPKSMTVLVVHPKAYGNSLA